MKNIATVGSSTATAVMPSGAAASAIVSPMLSPSIPETQTMSPAVASSTSIRSSPRNVSSLVSRRPVSTVPSRATLAIGALTRERAAEDAPDADAADVLVVVDRADQHLERAVFGRRFRDVLDDRFERAARDCRSRSSRSYLAIPALPLV